MSATRRGTLKFPHGRGSAVWWSWGETVPRLELWTGATISSRLAVTGLSEFGDRTLKRVGCASATPRSRSGTGIGQQGCDRGLVSHLRLVGTDWTLLDSWVGLIWPIRIGPGPTSRNGGSPAFRATLLGRGPAEVAVQVWRGFGAVGMALCIFYAARTRGLLYGVKVYSVSCGNYAYISQFLDLSRKC